MVCSNCAHIGLQCSVPRESHNQSTTYPGLGVSSLGEPTIGYEERDYRSFYHSARVKDELEKLKGSVHQLDNDVSQVRNVSSRTSTSSSVSMRRFSRDTETTKKVIEDELKYVPLIFYPFLTTLQRTTRQACRAERRTITTPSTGACKQGTRTPAIGATVS